MNDGQRVRRAVASPFTEIYALAYYDGPEAGFARTGDSAELLFFYMIDHDRLWDYRIFALCRVPDTTYDDARVSIEISLDAAGEFAESVRPRARPVAVLAALNIREVIDAWLDVDETFDFAIERDWFAFFGISREGLGD